MIVNKKQWLYGIGSASVAAFLASLCCTGPGLLAYLGLSALGVSLAGHHNALVLAAVIIVAFALRSLRSNCERCESGESRATLFSIRLGDIVTFLLGSLVLPTLFASSYSKSPQPKIHDSSSTSRPGLSAPIRCESCEK